MERETKQALLSGYRVYVDDNFHYMDKDERWTLGEFPSYEEAVRAAEALVESFFNENWTGQPGDEILSNYKMFGDDPWIVAFGGASEPSVKFSAWDYAGEISSLLSSGRFREYLGKRAKEKTAGAQSR